MENSKKLIDFIQEELRRRIDHLALGLQELALNSRAETADEEVEESLLILEMQKELVAAVHYAKHNRFYNALLSIDNYRESAEYLASFCRKIITGRYLQEYNHCMMSGNKSRAFEIVDMFRTMGLHN